MMQAGNNLILADGQLLRLWLALLCNAAKLVLLLWWGLVWLIAELLDWCAGFVLVHLSTK